MADPIELNLTNLELMLFSMAREQLANSQNALQALLKKTANSQAVINELIVKMAADRNLNIKAEDFDRYNLNTDSKTVVLLPKKVENV